MPVDPLVTRIVERVQASLPVTVSRSVSRTFREVTAYPSSPDTNLAADLTAHTETVFSAALNSLLDGRRATREDFPITASQARRRLRQGVALPDFLTGSGSGRRRCGRRSSRRRARSLRHGMLRCTSPST